MDQLFIIPCAWNSKNWPSLSEIRALRASFVISFFFSPKPQAWSNNLVTGPLPSKFQRESPRNEVGDQDLRRIKSDSSCYWYLYWVWRWCTDAQKNDVRGRSQSLFHLPTLFLFFLTLWHCWQIDRINLKSVYRQTLSSTENSYLRENRWETFFLLNNKNLVCF